MRLRLLLPLGLAALLAACNDGATPCARVTCDHGYTCNASTGVCEKSDGGTGGGDGGQTDGGGGGTGNCSPACTSPQVCDPSSNTCVGCVSNANCSCPTPVCSAAQTCVDGAGLPQPTGESCLKPAALIFPGCGDTTQFEVDLSALADDESGSCSALMGLGKDAVYSLTLTQPKDVTVTVTPATGVQAVVYLRDDPCASGHELVCSDTLGSAKTLHLKSLAAGTYWLVVDSYSQATAGSVDVKVELSAPTLPSNETCGTALPLQLDGGAVLLDLSGADDDYTGSCNATTGISPEAVYVASITAPADLRFTATPLDGGEAVIYVRGAPCATGQELYCSNPFNGVPSAYLRAAPAGDYYVFVEAYDLSTAGSFLVTGTASTASPAPPNDTCSQPRLINSPTAASPVVITGIDTAADSDDYTGSCNTTPKSPDEVFQLHVTAAGNYTVSVSASAGSSAFPVAYLRTAPCDFPNAAPPDSGTAADAGTELLCTFSSTSVFLDPGDYFLYVEGLGVDGAGPTDLTISLQ